MGHNLLYLGEVSVNQGKFTLFNASGFIRTRNWGIVFGWTISSITTAFYGLFRGSGYWTERGGEEKDQHSYGRQADGQWSGQLHVLFGAGGWVWAQAVHVLGAVHCTTWYHKDSLVEDLSCGFHYGGLRLGF